MNTLIDPSDIRRPPDWRARQAYADAAAGRLRPPRLASRAQRWLTLKLQGLADNAEDALHAILRDPTFQEFRPIVHCYCHRDRAAQLEALLLARVPWTIIETAHSFKCVPNYAELFFDVADRLDDVSFIVECAVAPEGRIGPPRTARRRVAKKLFGYFCGADALDDLYRFGRRPAAAEYYKHPVDFSQLASAIAQADAVADWVLSTAKSPPVRQIDRQLKSIRELLGNVCRTTYPRSASAQAVRNAVILGGPRLQPSPSKDARLPITSAPSRMNAPVTQNAQSSPPKAKALTRLVELLAAKPVSKQS